jgi:hypothetical protein
MNQSRSRSTIGNSGLGPNGTPNHFNQEIASIQKNNYVHGEQLDQTIGATTESSVNPALSLKFPHSTKNASTVRGQPGGPQVKLKSNMVQHSAQYNVKSANQLKTYSQPTGFQVNTMKTINYDKSSNF